MKTLKKLILFSIIGCATVPTKRSNACIYVDYVVHFASNSASIRDVSTPILDDVVSVIRTTQPEINVIMQGNSDTREERSEKLSLQRAQAVKDYFVSKGIDPNRLFTEGFGSGKPVSTNETDVGRAKNRRVEFRVIEIPSVFEGLRNVPVSELEMQFKTQLNEKNVADAEFLGRFHQVVYAKRARKLPVETWSGKDFYSWAGGDPGSELVLPAADAISEKEAKSHLDQAIKYFSHTLKLPSPPQPPCEPNAGELKKLDAYRGLLWSYWVKNQKQKAEKLFVEYQNSIGRRERDPHSLSVQADTCFAPLSPEFKADPRQSVEKARACYEELINQTGPSDLGHHPNYIDVGNMPIKIRLAELNALQVPRDQALASYQILFEEAFALDQKLLVFPNAEASYSLQVWRLMLPHLDADKDAALIETNQVKLRNANLRTRLNKK